VFSPQEARLSETPLQITLTLKGECAEKGVALDAFESFIDHFISALRYHYRASRAEVIKKTGRPFAEDQAVTAFRLVEFRTGSGVAVLEPPLADVDGQGSADPFADVPTLAWVNVANLLDTIDAGRPLEEPVVSELELATKSLGERGRFSIEYRAQGRTRKRELDEAWLTLVRTPEQVAEPRPYTISGVLHAIDLEPDKVGIRTANGLDWACRYPADLERDVLPLLGTRVWAHGKGLVTSARSGTLELESIHPVAEFEQTKLFTGPVVPLGNLIEQQGLRAPQGLLALADPDWAPGDESDKFLEALQD
jgi:hypothetical protein